MKFPPPEWARAGAEQALASTEGNHYAPLKGGPVMYLAIKDFYGTQFGKALDVETKIVVTSGANEGKSPLATCGKSYPFRLSCFIIYPFP